MTCRTTCLCSLKNVHVSICQERCLKWDHVLSREAASMFAEQLIVASARYPVPKWRSSPSARGYPRSAPLFVAGDRFQLLHVLQQDAAALQVQDTVLAPRLQLTVDALACR